MSDKWHVSDFRKDVHNILDWGVSPKRKETLKQLERDIAKYESLSGCKAGGLWLFCVGRPGAAAMTTAIEAVVNHAIKIWLIIKMDGKCKIEYRILNSEGLR